MFSPVAVLGVSPHGPPRCLPLRNLEVIAMTSPSWMMSSFHCFEEVAAQACGVANDHVSWHKTQNVALEGML